MAKGYLNVTTIWANCYGRPIKSNSFMKNWTIYDERDYLNITTWANRYGRPIKSKLFMKIWTMYGERPIYMANPFSHHLMDVLHPK